ncbi:MAG: hypothetical protein AcusKO_13770 [Acuticoccus sp.]
MTVLQSSLDPETLSANTAAMAALAAADLDERLAEAAEGGPPRARERHLKRGKLLPRQRVDTLLDRGSPFLELSPLAAGGLYDDRIHGAGLITGIASAV